MAEYLNDKMLLLSFGERLRALREFHGMSQRDLANAARIGRTTIAGYENGRNEPGLTNLHRLTAALGVSLDTLVGW